MTPPAAAVAPAPAPRRVRPLPSRGLKQRPHAPIGPRRVSGPARPSTRTPARTREREHARGAAGAGYALLVAAAGLAEHRLLDRVLRGRVWIALVTCALLGIVTLQLGLLELNGSIGRALQRRAQLLRENAALSIESSTLASDEHVTSAATQDGMVAVPLTSLRFLAARGASAAHAAAALRAPLQAQLQPAGTQPAETQTGTGAAAAEPTGAGSGESPGGGASTSGEGSGAPASEAQATPATAPSAGGEASSSTAAPPTAAPTAAPAAPSGEGAAAQAGGSSAVESGGG